MRFIIIKKKTLFMLVSVFILVLLTILFISFFNKTKETFNSDVYYKGNVEEKIMAFACNVDWGNEYIIPLLEISEKHDIKITFFVTGRWAENNPDLLKAIFNEGHEIGNHGYNHINYDQLSYEKNKEEILKADNTIQNILGIKPNFFAPPAGAYNENTIKACKDLNYDIIMWSIDTIDWREDSTKEKIKNRVIENIHNSAIVLMHPTKETIKALPEIIINILDKGYKIGKISDVVKTN